MPPSLPWRILPLASKTMLRESGWGEVLLAPPPLPFITTCCQVVAGTENTPRKTLAVKLLAPLTFGNGEFCRSPAMKTTFGSVGSATMEPWNTPCLPGKIDGEGAPIEVQVV